MGGHKGRHFPFLYAALMEDKARTTLRVGFGLNRVIEYSPHFQLYSNQAERGIMTEEEQKPRAGAAKIMKYMGKKPGQSLADAAAEIKELTDLDMQQLRTGIEDGTLTY